MQTRREFTAATLAIGAASCSPGATDSVRENVVNDVTQLNPIRVERVATPTTVEDVATLIRNHDGPISIGGGRFSQGGQIAREGALFIDMRRLKTIHAIDEAARTIRAEAGATWRDIQEAVDPLDLSPAIMQSFCNFTVGGSLSVNCHGDYNRHGPIIESVRSIELIVAAGARVHASRDENRDLFHAAIGGYGGVGVIVEATLDLAPNQRLERLTHRMSVAEYPAWHRANVLIRPEVILHHAVIYPDAYTNVAAEVSTLTDKPLTIGERLAPLGRPGAAERSLLDIVTFAPGGRAVHEHLYDPLTTPPAVVRRNYEAARDAYSLEPASRVRSTYALQEYFVPEEGFDDFAAAMARILTTHRANVLNVAVRHTRADLESMLSWARSDVYSFVLYYQQGTSTAAKDRVHAWTRELIDAALAAGGCHYLPYQIHASGAQFLAGYPRAAEFFALKRRIDPDYKFRNRLWDAYYDHR